VGGPEGQWEALSATVPPPQKYKKHRDNNRTGLKGLSIAGQSIAHLLVPALGSLQQEDQEFKAE
jgi:hypothetical protein